MSSSAEQKLKVGYFVPPSATFAGIERVVHELADGLMEAHGDVLEIHVIYSTRYDSKIIDDARYRCHTLDVHRLRQVAGKLRSAVTDIGLDILICPQVEASVTAWIATRGLRLPVFISHLHGNPRIEEAEGTVRTKIAFQLYRHLVGPRISGVLAVAPSLATFAAESLVRSTPVYFAKNPLRAFPPAGPVGPGRPGVRLVNVARLSRQKGQDVLLRALAIARTDVPDLTLTVVGSGVEEPALKALCRELGLDDAVTFAGHVADPTPYFGDADCFVLSSRWEGFGLVLLEALHFGLPLLAGDCEFGPADVITDDRVGQLVAKDDPDSLAAGMVLFAHSTPRTEDRRFRQELVSQYHRDVVVERHFAVLTEICSQSRDASVRGRAVAR